MKTAIIFLAGYCLAFLFASWLYTPGMTEEQVLEVLDENREKWEGTEYYEVADEVIYLIGRDVLGE